jgi:E3 ubiquitin-protein ligase NEDD4
MITSVTSLETILNSSYLSNSAILFFCLFDYASYASNINETSYVLQTMTVLIGYLLTFGTYLCIAASAVDPLNLKYFIFSGRLIGLALMHKVQVGIVLDRTLFLHLAGRSITLEDIAAADPVTYASCKRILEMGAADIDDLTLTFSRDVHTLGSRRTIELCPGGQDIPVNIINRQHYIDLLIKNIFVDSISDQLANFAKGFSDILVNPKLQKVFFGCLDLEDFDQMLGGSNTNINLKDWRSHTQYNGYKEKDRQVNWFWKVCLI